MKYQISEVIEVLALLRALNGENTSAAETSATASTIKLPKRGIVAMPLQRYVFLGDIETNEADNTMTITNGFNVRYWAKEHGQGIGLGSLAMYGRNEKDKLDRIDKVVILGYKEKVSCVIPLNEEVWK